MDLPKYFELDGKYAAMLPAKDGGVHIIKEQGSANIADFMQNGMIISENDLPNNMKASLADVRKEEE